MRYSFAYLVALIGLIIVFGCSSTGIEKIDVYEMKDFKDIKPNTQKVITNRADINSFNHAIKGAKKHHGIADMADPHYMIDLGERNYFLWIDEDSGTIMNAKNTHTTYGLTKKAAAKLYAIVTNQFRADPN